MRTPIRVTAAAAVAAAAMTTAATPAFASASNPGSSGSGHAVFVQTDNTAGNRVVAYQRAADGTLTRPAATPPAVAAASWPGPWSTTPRPRAR